jgi:hypothetical protein
MLALLVEIQEWELKLRHEIATASTQHNLYACNGPDVLSRAVSSLLGYRNVKMCVLRGNRAVPRVVLSEKMVLQLPGDRSISSCLARLEGI